MLPKNLLVVRKHRPHITPLFAGRDEHTLVAQVLELYTPGRTLGGIWEDIGNLETHKNFKRARGIATVLMRNSTFRGEWKVDPVELRRYLFTRGYVTAHEEREKRVRDAAAHFNVDIKTVERDFWGDREENHVLVEPPQGDVEGIIKHYNLSLMQTLLFDALGMKLTLGGNYQRIFGLIKYLGLMYEVDTATDDEVAIGVTGPVSLFKKTKKYGTAFARLVPSILRARTWRIQAKIETVVAGETRIYDFDMDDSKGEVFPKYVETESFDSGVEQEFAVHFRSLGHDWTLLREPTVLTAGATVMIPDFCFERRGTRVYMEVVGFWTPDYLKKKIGKVRKINKKILLAVDKNLECTGRDFRGEHVDIIFYDTKIPMLEVVRRLRRIEEIQDTDELRMLEEKNVSLDGLPEEVIPIPTLAERYQVGVAAMKQYIENHHGEIAHMVVGDNLVAPRVIEEIRTKILEMETRSVMEVEKIIHGYNLDVHALEAMGFHVIWNSLNPDDAIVVPKKD